MYVYLFFMTQYIPLFCKKKKKRQYSLLKAAVICRNLTESILQSKRFQYTKTGEKQKMFIHKQKNKCYSQAKPHRTASKCQETYQNSVNKTSVPQLLNFLSTYIMSMERTCTSLLIDFFLQGAYSLGRVHVVLSIIHSAASS